MVMAELCGKVSRSGANISDRSEDLLTSDTFGALRYLPPDEGLIPMKGDVRDILTFSGWDGTEGLNHPLPDRGWSKSDSGAVGCRRRIGYVGIYPEIPDSSNRGTPMEILKHFVQDVSRGN